MSFFTEAYFMEACDGKDLAIMERAFDIDMMKIEHMLTAVESQLEIHLAESELKVVNESGTMDDLSMLYEAAGEDATKKKEGIIAKAVNAIATFFGKISAFIKEKILKMEMPKSVEVDSGLADAADQVGGLWNKVKELLAKIKGKQVAGCAVLIAGIFAVVKAGIKETGKRKKIDNPKALIGKLDQIASETQTAFNEPIVAALAVIEKQPVVDGEMKDLGEVKKKSIVNSVFDAVKAFGKFESEVANKLIAEVKGLGKVEEVAGVPAVSNNGGVPAVKESGEEFEANIKALLESIDDSDEDDAMMEGANLEARAELKKIQFVFKTKMKQAKKELAAGDATKGKATLKEAKSELEKGEKVIKSIMAAADESVWETIKGNLLYTLLAFGKTLLVGLVTFGVGGVLYSEIKNLEHTIRAIQEFIEIVKGNREFNASFFNGYRREVENALKSMHKTIDAAISKADKLLDTDVEESAAVVNSFGDYSYEATVKELEEAINAI